VKHLSKILIAVMMVMGLSSHAQDSKITVAVSLITAIRTTVGGGNG
jgi:hypothetical protein